MAFVYYPGRITLMDAHQLRTTKEVMIRLDDATYTTQDAQIDQAIAMLSLFAEELDEVVDPVIISTTMSIPVTVAALKATPGEQGVAEGANLEFSTLDRDGDVHARPYWLPGAKAGVFLANFRDIDTGDAELLAWFGAFSGADSEIVISDGEVVQSLTGGVYATRTRKAS